MKTHTNSFMFFLILLTCGCSYNSQPSSSNGEGSITYEITYPTNNPYKNVKVLPRETSLFFKGKKASFITTVMGMIQMVNLVDVEQKKFTSLLLNSMGETYAFTDTPEDVTEQETKPEFKIETSNEKKTIAGLECNKAVVFDLTNKRKFDIYYYKSIKTYLGNSPYKDFNYLLMEYADTKYGLPMQLVATKVDFSPIDTTLLTVHGEYNWVDKQTFISMIKNLSELI